MVIKREVYYSRNIKDLVKQQEDAGEEVGNNDMTYSINALIFWLKKGGIFYLCNRF